MENVIPTEIDKETLRALVKDGAQLVDVLSQTEFENSHLTGARNLPLETIDQHSTAELKMHEPVIVYCYDYQ